MRPDLYSTKQESPRSEFFLAPWPFIYLCPVPCWPAQRIFFGPLALLSTCALSPTGPRSGFFFYTKISPFALAPLATPFGTPKFWYPSGDPTGHPSLLVPLWRPRRHPSTWHGYGAILKNQSSSSTVAQPIVAAAAAVASAAVIEICYSWR